MVPSAFADNVVTVRCVRVFVEADEHAFKAAWVVHVSKIRVTSKDILRGLHGNKAYMGD